MKRHALLISLLLLLASCSSKELLHDKYYPLARAVQQGNGYLENLIIQTPSTPVNASSYMNELQRKSKLYYELLSLYTIEVNKWGNRAASGFSVFVWDDDKLILIDCNDTPEIDAWYFEKDIRENIPAGPLPCVGEFDITIE